jgi:hypothetical protein
MKNFLIILILFIWLVPCNSQTIPIDKQLHLYAGAVVGTWGTLTVSQETLWKPAVYGLGFATAAGAGKELIDFGGFGTPDWKDFGSSVLGGIVGVGITTSIKVIVRKHKQKHCKQKYKYNTKPVN